MSRLTADLKAKFGDKGYPACFDFKTFKGSDLAGTIARHPIYNHLRHSRESGNDKDWERALDFYTRHRPPPPTHHVHTPDSQPPILPSHDLYHTSINKHKRTNIKNNTTTHKKT